MTLSTFRFAEIAAALEDMHALAIEGHQADLSIDMASALAAALRQASGRLRALIADTARIGASVR